ncbi:hypothetical protein [Parendozoicomonas haliclonae]|uniref:Uncharacterized protein n=1 Tax=Parendozoicomonas haliclonae TaxID=1960125 RepID=A0A1X7AN01_9GAMM|nr:hypothetical protein [Parendozoicomonas haliclonae]SMA49417.1 hypothetical protein EHSB41UT_03248 [Parendozoicomonas haliclonae]
MASNYPPQVTQTPIEPRRLPGVELVRERAKVWESRYSKRQIKPTTARKQIPASPIGSPSNRQLQGLVAADIIRDEYPALSYMSIVSLADEEKMKDGSLMAKTYDGYVSKHISEYDWQMICRYNAFLLDVYQFQVDDGRQQGFYIPAHRYFSDKLQSDDPELAAWCNRVYHQVSFGQTEYGYISYALAIADAALRDHCIHSLNLANGLDVDLPDTKPLIVTHRTRSQPVTARKRPLRISDDEDSDQEEADVSSLASSRPTPISAKVSRSKLNLKDDSRDHEVSKAFREFAQKHCKASANSVLDSFIRQNRLEATAKASPQQQAKELLFVPTLKKKQDLRELGKNLPNLRPIFLDTEGDRVRAVELDSLITQMISQYQSQGRTTMSLNHFLRLMLEEDTVLFNWMKNMATGNHPHLQTLMQYHLARFNDAITLTDFFSPLTDHDSGMDTTSEDQGTRSPEPAPEPSRRATKRPRRDSESESDSDDESESELEEPMDEAQAMNDITMQAIEQRKLDTARKWGWRLNSQAVYDIVKTVYLKPAMDPDGDFIPGDLFFLAYELLESDKDLQNKYLCKAHAEDVSQQAAELLSPKKKIMYRHLSSNS